MKKYFVEYSFTANDGFVRKSFVDFLSAMRYQGEIIKKYKDTLKYCMVKEGN